MALDELDLSPEELNELKQDGTVPGDWTPGGGPLSQVGGDEYWDTYGGEMNPEDYGISTSPLQAASVDPMTSARNALKTLTNVHAAIPGSDPMLDEFHKIATTWMPKDDSDFAEAKRRSDLAAANLAKLNTSQQNTQGLPWLKAAAAMLAPSRTGMFSENLSGATGAYADEEMQRQRQGQALNLEQAKLQLSEASQAEQRALGKAGVGVHMMSALAQIKRADAMLQRYGGLQNTALGKSMVEMGYDLNTPEGQLAARRSYVLQHGTPEMKELVLENPGTDPYSMEAAPLLAQKLKDKETKLQAQAAASVASAHASEARVPVEQAEAAAKRQQTAQESAPVGPSADVARQYGIPLSGVNPYGSMPRKLADNVFEKKYQESDKMQEDISKHLQDSDEMAQHLNEAERIIRSGLRTGADMTMPVDALINKVSPAASEFKTHAEYIVPHMRPQGAGSTSNYEEKMYRSATIGLDKPVETNLNTIALARKMRQITAQKQQVLGEYQSAGAMHDFNRYWNQYLKENYFQGDNVKPNFNVVDFHDWAKSKGMVK